MDEKKEEEEILVWQRCGSDSLLMRGIEDMMGLLSHAAKLHVKEAEKQIKSLKKFQ